MSKLREFHNSIRAKNVIIESLNIASEIEHDKWNLGEEWKLFSL